MAAMYKAPTLVGSIANCICKPWKGDGPAMARDANSVHNVNSIAARATLLVSAAWQLQRHHSQPPWAPFNSAW